MQAEAEWRQLGAIIDQDKRQRELLRQRAMEERTRKTQEVWRFCWVQFLFLNCHVMPLEAACVTCVCSWLCIDLIAACHVIRARLRLQRVQATFGGAIECMSVD